MPNIYPTSARRGYIYRITNSVNGKVYIGRTGREPDERFTEHVRYSNSPSSRNKYIVHRAIHKYGADQFNFDPIFCLLDYKDSAEFERHFISEYDCCTLDGSDKGYNQTRGGDGFDSESSKLVQAKRRASGGNWHGDLDWSRIARENCLKRVAAGTHPWAGDEHVAKQKQLWADGTHPFIGLQQKLLEEGRHTSQRPGFSDFIRQVQIDCMQDGRSALLKPRKCPHCGFEWIGITHNRFHFDLCKKNPNYDPAKDNIHEQWKVTKPDGTSEIIFNMKSYCKQNGLWPSAMTQVAQGKQKAHKGYTCRKITQRSEDADP